MRLHQLAFLLAPLLLAACGPVVVKGGSDDPDDLVDPDDPPAEQLDAVALSRAQMDILWEEYWATHDSSGSSTSGGGGGLDPNDLFLRTSNLGVSCGSPTTELPCGGHYNVALVLPPALQQVGVYDLEDPLIVAYSHISETGMAQSADPEDCGWGGGSPGVGTVEILSIDSTQVHFKLDVSGGFWSSYSGGEYVAPRCAD